MGCNENRPCKGSNVKVAVSRCNHKCNPPTIYTTEILKPNCVCGNNALTQCMLMRENVKYVIKYDFTLLGEEITVPKNCIFEFDGGSLKNGTIVGQNTVFINVGDVNIWGTNLIRKGTWREHSGGGGSVTVDDHLSNISTNPVQNKVITKALEDGGILDKPYNPEAHSGLGRKILKLKDDGSNILTQEDFNYENIIYVIRYDFDLDGADIQIPEGCVIDFDGGSVTNGKLISNSTVLTGKFNNSKDCFIGVYYDESNNPLNYDFSPNGEYVLPAKFASSIYTLPEEVGILDFSYSIVSPQGLASDSNYFYVLFNCVKENVEYTAIVLYDRLFKKLGVSVIDLQNCHGNDATIYNGNIYIAREREGGCVVLNTADVVTHCSNNENIDNPQVIMSNVTIANLDYDPYTETFCVYSSFGGSGIYDTNFNKIKDLPYLHSIIEDSLSPNDSNITIESILYRRGVIYHLAWYVAYDNVSYPANQAILSVIDINKEVVVFNKIITTASYAFEPEGFCWDDVYGCPIFSVRDVRGFSINLLTQNSNISTPATTSAIMGVTFPDLEVYVDNSYTGFSNGSRNCPYKTLAEALAMSDTSRGALSIHMKETEQDYYLKGFSPKINYLRIRSFSGKAKVKADYEIINTGTLFDNVKISSLKTNEIAIRVNGGELTVNSCNLNANSTTPLFDVKLAKLSLTGTNNILSDNAAQVSIENANLAFRLYQCTVDLQGYLNCTNVLMFKTSTSNIFLYNTFLHNLFVNASNYYFVYNTSYVPIDIPPVSAEIFFENQFYINLPNRVLGKSIRLYVYTRYGSDPTYYIYPHTYLPDFGMWRCEKDERKFAPAPDTVASLSVLSQLLQDNPNACSNNVPIWVHEYGTVYCGGTTIKNGDGRTAALFKGTSQQRPTTLNNGVDVGFEYFDTTLNKQLYWTGDASVGADGWVDALGNNPDA